MAIKSQPSLQVLINSVIELYSNGQIQEALDTAGTLIKDYPNEAILYNISGACYASLVQLDTAVKLYEKAIAVKSDYAEAHNNLGNALKELGQLDAAVKVYEKSIAFNRSIQLVEVLKGNTKVIVRLSIVRFYSYRFLVELNCCIQLT